MADVADPQKKRLQDAIAKEEAIVTQLIRDVSSLEAVYGECTIAIGKLTSMKGKKIEKISEVKSVIKQLLVSLQNHHVAFERTAEVLNFVSEKTNSESGEIIRLLTNKLRSQKLLLTDEKFEELESKLNNICVDLLTILNTEYLVEVEIKGDLNKLAKDVESFKQKVDAL